MTKKEKIVERCITCQQPLVEANLSSDLTLKVCPNKSCPRFGLITVVFVKIKPTPTKIVKDEKTKVKKSKHS